MISDEALATFELSNDLPVGEIVKERYPYYVNASLNLGREAAGRVKESGIADTFQPYEETGMKTIYEEKSGEQYRVSSRAQNECGKDGSAKVMIYRQSIAELAKHSWEVELTEEEALRIHLTHEYFHYLEYHSSEIRDERTMKYYEHGSVSDYLGPVELSRIFGRRRTGGVLRCSEIATHAFARELIGISILPNYFDYAYLMAEEKVREADFLERVKEYEILF